jgi:hypothetical protein
MTTWYSGGTLSKFGVSKETKVENLKTLKLAQKVTDPHILHTFMKAAALTRLMLDFEGPRGGVRVGAGVDSEMIGGSGSSEIRVGRVSTRVNAGTGLIVPVWKEILPNTQSISGLYLQSQLIPSTIEQEESSGVTKNVIGVM